MNILCKKCKGSKDQYYFNRDKRRKSGRRDVCKDCTRKEHACWRDEHQPHVKERNKINYEIFKTRITYRYSRTKASAKQRGILFDISFTDFVKIIAEVCFYCGTTGSIGLDRIDSKEGYIIENVAPACYRCNVAKNTLSQREFLELCALIISNDGKRKNSNSI